MERTVFIDMKSMDLSVGTGRRMMAGGKVGNILTALLPVSPIVCGNWTKISKQTKFVFTGRSGAGQMRKQPYNGPWKQIGNKLLYGSTAAEFRAAMN